MLSAWGSPYGDSELSFHKRIGQAYCPDRLNHNVVGENEMNVKELKSMIDVLDLGGLTGRDAMRFVGQACIMSLLGHRGAAKLLAEKLGFASSGVLSVATAEMGWRVAGTRDADGGNKTAKNVKIKGNLPSKTSAAIAKVLGLDLEYDDIGWPEYLRAVDMQGADWIDHLYVRLGGRDSDGGKDFTAWIDSNRMADIAKAEAVKAAAEKAAREADPLFQAKERIKRLDAKLNEKELEITELKARIAALQDNPTYDLNKDMLRLISQRFHPDRANGNAELCGQITSWINSIATAINL